MADRVAQKAGGNTRLEIFLRDFAFDSRIAFEARDRNNIHVVGGELEQLRDLRLDKNCGLSRVKPDGKIIQRDVQNIFVNLSGCAGVVGEGLGVGNHNVNFVELAGIL